MAADGHHRRTPCRALAECRQRYPERLSHFGALNDRRLRLHHGHEWPNDDRRQCRRPRTDVIERAQYAAVTGEIDAGLFPCFAHGRLLQVVISRLHAASRTCNVTAPWIPFRLGALDHEQLGIPGRRMTLARPKHECDRRQAPRRIVGRDADAGPRRQRGAQAEHVGELQQGVDRRHGPTVCRNTLNPRRRRRARPCRGIHRPWTRRRDIPSAGAYRRRTPSGSRWRSKSRRASRAV